MNPSTGTGLFTAIVFALGVAALAGTSESVAQDPAAQTSPENTPADIAPAEPATTVAPAAKPPAYRDLRRITRLRGDPAAGKAKSELCAACHGAAGISIAPNFPNLAGQRAEYLYWELVEYQSGAMPESAMTPLAASLNEQDMRDLALYYASLPAGRAPAQEEAPAPDTALLERGRQLFMEGDPGKGLPPCQGCHGADAGGHPLAASDDRDGHAPWSAYPSLRGQNAIYLQVRLNAFRTAQLHHSTNDFVMGGVGQRLDDDTISALSAWLAAQGP